MAAWRAAPRAGVARQSATPRPASPSDRPRLADAKDIDAAVAAAKRALPLWAGTHADERARILHRAADLIEERLAAIADLLTREQGKPIPDAEKEIRFGVEVIRYYAEEGRRIGGSIRASSRRDIRSLVVSSPVGVVGAITPWNYPVDIYAWKVGPALAAGCTMVVKPPHETPLAIGLVVQCFADAGLPPGVLNDLPGTGPEAGAALAAHPDVRDDHRDRLDRRGTVDDARRRRHDEAPDAGARRPMSRSSCSTTPMSPRRRARRRGARSPTWGRSASR